MHHERQRQLDARYRAHHAMHHHHAHHTHHETRPLRRRLHSKYLRLHRLHRTAAAAPRHSLRPHRRESSRPPPKPPSPADFGQPVLLEEEPGFVDCCEVYTLLGRLNADLLLLYS